MQSLRMSNDHKLENNSRQPKLYLRVRLNYLTAGQLCDKSKRNQIQRLFNFLCSKTGRLFKDQSNDKQINQKRSNDEDKKMMDLNRKYEYLKELSRFNLEKELKGYFYGYPSKKELDQMQLILRTHHGDKYLLLKVNESRSSSRSSSRSTDEIDGEIRDGDLNEKIISSNRNRMDNQLMVNVEILRKIFKRLKVNLSDANENQNFVLELNGYRLKIILIIIYAIYTNQLYLTLDTFPEIIRISIDLGIEQIIKLIKKLINQDDPIYLFLKLRNYLSNLTETSITNTQKMTSILKQIIINYEQLIQHPAIIDLDFREINFLICKNQKIFRTFKLTSSVRDEFQVLKGKMNLFLKLIRSVLRSFY